MRKRILFSSLTAVVIYPASFLVLSMLAFSPVLSALIAAALAAASGAVSAFYVSGVLSKRMARLQAFSEDMAIGDFGIPPSSLLSARDEIGSLESSLARMSIYIRSLIDKLKDEKSQREAVLASMGEGVVVTDQRGVVTLANRRAGELFGGPLTGRNVVEISRETGLYDLVEQGKGGLSPVKGEIRLSGRKATCLSVVVSPLIINMNVQGSVIVFHDITELERLENMRKDFVANVSHELKTPLTAIKGFAETLSGGAIDDRGNAAGFVETIRRNADRLARLVDDLLTLSNIELGKMKFDIKPVRVQDAVDSVLSTLRPSAVDKGLGLAADVGEKIMVMADRDRLEQVLLNLVDNGIKFTGKGGVDISAVRVGDRVSIAVRDTGAGIPAKDIKRIGERFYRVDPARSRELGGTGLGLAIVKHLVTSMCGTFSVESKTGRGTKVTFTLPAF